MTKSKNSNTLINDIAVNQAVMLTKLNNLEKEVAEIKEQLGDKYVTQDQFAPVKSVVYGLVSVTLMAVVGAVIALVIKK